MQVKVELYPVGVGIGNGLTAHGPFMSFYPNVSCLYAECRIPLEIENYKEALDSLKALAKFGVFKCPKCQGLHSVGVNRAWGVHLSPTRGELRPINERFVVNPNKARRIESTETFTTEITYTPEMQEKLRKAADQSCVICFGRGLWETPDKGLKMCSCLDV